jgi:hypothetical protein
MFRRESNWMAKIDTAAIFAEVKANTAKLSSCAGPHVFLPDEVSRHMLFPDYKCQKCAGKQPGIDTIHYLEGLKHGLNCDQDDVVKAIAATEKAKQDHWTRMRAEAKKDDPTEL